MKSIDEILYRNIEHLLEKNGISERACTASCELNPNFFSNYKKGTTKHFRVCDIIKIAESFEVSIDDLCEYANSSDDFFIPRHKIKPRDEKIMINAFRKLDAEGRINVADAINKELEASRERALLKNIEKRRKKTEVPTR